MRIGMMAAVVGLAAGLGLGAGERVGMENAALEYYKGWSLLNDTRVDVIDTRGDEISVTKDGEKQLVEAKESILILKRAAGMAEADWGIDLGQGPSTLLPHLGLIRQTARLMAAAALEHAENGELDVAAEYLGALHRVGVHASTGETLISSLVGLAIGNLGVGLTNQMIDDGQIDAEGARVVLDAIARGDADDRYGLRDAVVGEWRMISEYLLKHAPDERPGVWLAEEVGIATDGAEGKRLLAMSREDLLREIGGYAAYHGALLSAMNSGDRAALYAVSERLKDGDYGDLSLLIAPAVTRAYESARESKSQTDALIRRLEGIAN